MEKIQEELKSLPEGDNSRRLLYEKMADKAVDIGNFKSAITYYGKTVKICFIYNVEMVKVCYHLL